MHAPQREQKLGWSTWASSPPKDYLLKFLIEGGNSQHIVIDDILPKVYKTRDATTQNRLTNLYIDYIQYFAKILNYNNILITKVSDFFSFPQFIELSKQTSIHDIKRALPLVLRRNISQLSYLDVVHVIFEFAAYSFMFSQGVKSVIRGSGQRGLVNVFLQKFKEGDFTLLDYRITTERYIEEESRLSNTHKKDVVASLELWRKAKLLKGYSHADSHYLEDLAERGGEEHFTQLFSLINFFKKYKCCLLLCGSWAQRGRCNPPKYKHDIDLCVMCEEEIPIPRGFNDMPNTVKHRFQKGDVPSVSLKTGPLNGAQEISIRYINTTFAFNLYKEKTDDLLYWRQQSLLERGIKKEKLTDIHGREFYFSFIEEPYLNGFLIPNFHQIKGGMTPVINFDTHMLLTGRVLVDNICGFTIKRELIKNISSLEKIIPEHLLRAIKARMTVPLDKDMEEEIVSLIHVTSY